MPFFARSVLVCPVDAITLLPIKRCLPGAKREHRWIFALRELFAWAELSTDRSFRYHL
jgi:hypothetical protein